MILISKQFKAQQRVGAMAIHVIYIRLHDYDKAKQDGGAKKMKCVSSNDRTHASINHIITVVPRMFLVIYLYTAYLGEYFHT